jgi:hypothetical protein
MKHCLNCKKEIRKRTKIRKFCSRKCYSFYKRVKRLKLKCLVCGNEFEKRLCDLTKGRGKYCSKKCEWIGKRKEGNPNWKGNNATFSTGRARAGRWFKKNRPCKICGSLKTEKHHKDGNPLNNNPKNIEWLCRRHHQEADGRLKNGKLFLNKNYH